MPKDEVRAIYVDVGSLVDEHQKAIAREDNLDLGQAIIFPRRYKNRLRSIAIGLQQMVDNSNMGEKLEISEDLTCELKRLLSSVNYLLNSTSFRAGDKYYDFDKMEIDRKLGRK